MFKNYTPHPLVEALETAIDDADYMETWNRCISKLQENFTTVPLPSQFQYNEEYFMWIDIVESVVQAKKQFVMFELGAGYGRSCIDAVTALKFLNPIPFQFVAVEAEKNHFKFLTDYFRAHGLNLLEHKLVQAAVSHQAGNCLFHMGDANHWYGQCIANGVTVPLVEEDPLKRGIEVVKTVSLNSLLSEFQCINLIDMDIQGSELDVLSASIELLNKKVKRLHVATHSPKIDSEVEELFSSHGWKNIYLFSCLKKNKTPYGKIVFQDGIQSWINPRLK